MNLIKRISLIGMAAGLLLATTVIATDIPQQLVPLAQELGCRNTVECAQKFDANIGQGITLAQKYNIYTPEQNKVASTFKTEVLERLSTVSQDNFEEEILALANKILKEKPALAKTMGVTRQGVDSAETIINTVKDAGADIRTCQKSPEDLSREQLIACVKAGNDLSKKEKLVGDYIPKENIKAAEAEKMLNLENSLLAGEYPGLGKVSVEEAGQTCLKPGSESITDCDQIARKFFGAEGVKELQKARDKNNQIKEYYQQGLEKMELVTPDGQKIIGKDAIKNTCDKAFNNSDLNLARACGNFAVKNGYATEQDTEDGLKLLETFSQKAQGTKFDDCRFNPESCQQFLPDEFRSQFDSQSKIFKVMSDSIGFDPARCADTFDPDIGKRCLEGAKKALSQVEEIAKNSPEAQKIVNEIKSHISEGEQMTKKLNEFNNQNSMTGGMAGPGGCKSPQECFQYCNQPVNSAECISFGAKSQIFDQNTAVQKFNMVNERLGAPPSFDYRSFQNTPDFSDQFRQSGQFGQQPGFNQPPNPPTGYPNYPNQYQPVGPSPECFAAISSGDFAKAKIACSSTTNTYDRNYPQPIQPPFPVCQNVMPSPCAEGQMRQAASDAKGCMTYGDCVAIENYKPIDTSYPKPCPSGAYWNGTSCVVNPIPDTAKTINCPMMPTVSSCPAGQEKYETYRSNECGVYYGCRDTTMKTSCPSGQYWDGKSCVAQPVTQCASGQWWDSATQSCKSSPVPTIGSCNYATQYWKPSNSTCQPRTNCTDTTNSEYNSQECQGVRGMTQPVGSGCGSLTTQATCQASPGCGWANGACGGNTITPTVGSCNYATQYWKPSNSTCQPRTNCTDTTNSEYNSQECQGVRGMNTTSGTCPTNYHFHSESGGFCMNSQENYSGTCYNSAGTSTITCPQQTYTSPTACTMGQYWNGTACVTSSTTGQCPSGQYWNTPPGGGAGYCMPTSAAACSSGQYWNGTACVSSTTSGGTGCGSPSAQTQSACLAISGCNWFNNACSASTSTSTPPAGGCPAGQYWNGTACIANTTTNTYNTNPATMCSQAGGTWNSSTSFCQMPTTTTTCSSGQYWNGTSCVTSTPPPNTTTSDPATMCAQAGGVWTGSACQMATSISDQKAYLSYYKKQSNSLLAQVLAVFTGLFK